MLKNDNHAIDRNNQRHYKFLKIVINRIITFAPRYRNTQSVPHSTVWILSVTVRRNSTTYSENESAYEEASSSK